MLSFPTGWLLCSSRSRDQADVVTRGALLPSSGKRPQIGIVSRNGMATCTHVRTRRDKDCFPMFLVTIETGSILSPLYLTYFHLNELPISCSCCPIIYSSLSHSHISRTDCQVRAFSASPRDAAPPTRQPTLQSVLRSHRPRTVSEFGPQPVEATHVT